MAGTQYWAGIVLALIGILVIVVSIPSVGIAGVIGLQNPLGRLALGIAAVILAVGTLLIGTSGQEQPI